MRRSLWLVCLLSSACSWNWAAIGVDPMDAVAEQTVRSDASSENNTPSDVFSNDAILNDGMLEDRVSMPPIDVLDGATSGGNDGALTDVLRTETSPEASLVDVFVEVSVEDVSITSDAPLSPADAIPDTPSPSDGSPALCGPGQLECGGMCIDPQSSNSHCGRCGVTCDSRSTQCCGGTCINMQTSVQHCGRCGNACTDTQTCTAGRCVPRECRNDTDCVAPTVRTYCQRVSGGCPGDVSFVGQCAVRCEITDPLTMPVCGCNGRNYPSPNDACVDGVNVRSSGTCDTSR